MKYKVILITHESDHEAVRHLEDDEALIIEDENGCWGLAEDFFFQKNIKEFTVE